MIYSKKYSFGMPTKAVKNIMVISLSLILYSILIFIIFDIIDPTNDHNRTSLILSCGIIAIAFPYGFLLGSAYGIISFIAFAIILIKMGTPNGSIDISMILWIGIECIIVIGFCYAASHLRNAIIMKNWGKKLGSGLNLKHKKKLDEK